jgi:hypothetical protein
VTDSTSNNPNADAGFLLYPYPASGRVGRIEYIIKPTETGGLTLPLNLQRLAESYAIARAASKKSRDLDMMGKYDNLFNDGVERVNRKFAGQFGLNRNKTITIQDVVGYC